MDFINFAVNFLGDEVSGDSEEYDSVDAAAAVSGPDKRGGAPHGEFGGLDDGDDDRESAVGAKSETDGGEDVGDGEDIGDSEDDDEDDGDDNEEGSPGWWSTPEVGHGYEPTEEERNERVISTDRVEDARERDRRFWESCLESGYP